MTEVTQSEERLVAFGDNLRTWRRAQRLSSTIVAMRAGITRDTLRKIELGDPGVRVGNVFAVLDVLGVGFDVLTASDPVSSERGKLALRRALTPRRSGR